MILDKKIPISKPNFDEREYQAVVSPLKSGWVVQGPKVLKFDQPQYNNFSNENKIFFESGCCRSPPSHKSLFSHMSPASEAMTTNLKIL